MPRRLRAESEEAFSLFPFLAVLLCTMGTLALVFVLIAQKTSADPIEDAVEERAIAFDASAGLKDAVPYGSIIGADELAGWAETISYEVLLAITARVPREYLPAGHA